MTGRHAWVDASAGIAGDMLLGALLDAGADLEAVRQAVDAVIPGSVRITQDPVTRAGMRAAKAEVVLLAEDPPHRTWRTIQTLLTDADLASAVRERSLLVFAALARAEGRVHGIEPAAVHFHEVGALDSIADVVGVCAALHDLDISSVTVSEVALGAGHITAAHGTIPVPVPAVVELSQGWRVLAGGRGELTTPTGMALIAALAERSEDLPALTVAAIGVGAGTKDIAGRANVTRVLVGERTVASTGASADAGSDAVVIAANIDDLDPRLWPEILTRLLRGGADDAWLTPILMKKGRPAHTLTVLCAPDRAPELRAAVLAETSTIGLRQSTWTKYALPRTWISVDVDGCEVPIKIAHRDGLITQASAEFDAVATAAETLRRSQQDVLTAAMAAASTAGLAVGRPLPPSTAAPAGAE
jgi:uncharacterized protein (TIGR00299 family) protein